MSFTATTATDTLSPLETEFLISLIEIYNGLSGEETDLIDWMNNKESLCQKIKELVKKYGYTGPNNYTAIYWFYQGIKIERKRNEPDMSVGYEHSYYPARTKETILAKLKNFYKDHIENKPNILRYKTIKITI